MSVEVPVLVKELSWASYWTETFALSLFCLFSKNKEPYRLFTKNYLPILLKGTCKLRPLLVCKKSTIKGFSVDHVRRYVLFLKLEMKDSTVTVTACTKDTEKLYTFISRRSYICRFLSVYRIRMFLSLLDLDLDPASNKQKI
jgi:hypothetical protein